MAYFYAALRHQSLLSTRMPTGPGAPTHKSTLGYAVFLGANLVSWSSKRQHTVSQSSAEADYRAVANGVAEAAWLRQLL